LHCPAEVKAHDNSVHVFGRILIGERKYSYACLQ